MRGATAVHARAPCDTAFQSTLLMRGATRRAFSRHRLLGFQSTLHMRGATQAPPSRGCHCRDFNPRSSCEERPYADVSMRLSYVFQSTLLMRGATSSSHARARVEEISIHAPHARSDGHRNYRLCKLQAISIHAPHARSDEPLPVYIFLPSYFNPRSSCEERRSSPSTGPS